MSRFQTFQPLVNKYKKAIGLGTTLDDDELKALWKEHFARQITVSERTIMKTFQSAHLGPGDIAKIKKLSDGIFDDTVLYRLLALLAIVRTVQSRQYRHDVLEATCSSTQMGTQARFPTTKGKGKRAGETQSQRRQSIAKTKD